MAVWREYVENAYVSCFHYLVNKKLHWAEKICWLATLVLCMGCACFMVSEHFGEHQEQKAAFGVDTNYLDWDTPFPSVVFCETLRNYTLEERKFLTEMLHEAHVNETLYENLKRHLFYAAFIIPPRINFDDHLEPCQLLNSNCSKLSYSKAANKIRGNCTSMLDTCAYSGVTFKCCDEFLPVRTVYGKCFAFNNYGTRYPNGSRLTKFIWRVGHKLNVGGGNLTIIMKHTNMFLSILDPNAIPNLMNERSIFQQSHLTSLTGGVLHVHQAKIEETKSLKEVEYVDVEHKGCRFPNENYLKYFDFYSEANCKSECFMMAQKEYCNCIGHFCPVGPKEECSISGMKCISQHEKEFANLKCNCLPDCNSVRVDNVGTITKTVNEFRNNKKVKFNIIVSPPSLRYKRYIPVSQLDFIVIVGGTVSFFLGISFLSIVQILYYFLVRSVTDWCRLKKELKRMDKERCMDEYFITARRKLKLAKIEGDIKENMRRKAEKYVVNNLLREKSC